MEETKLDLRDISKIILKRRWLILGITILFMIAGIVVGFKQNTKQVVIVKDDIYLSTARVLIGNFGDSRNENIKDINMLNQQVAKIYGAVAASRTVAEKTINELSLDIKIDKFIENLKISTNPESQVVTITYGDVEEKYVQKITDTYLKISIIEAQKIYPEAKIKILDKASKPEKIAKEDFDKIGISKNSNEPQKVVQPENKSKSKKLLLAISCFTGIIVGFGLALLIEFMSNSIRKRDEAENILQIPIIAQDEKFDGNHKISSAESYKILRSILQYKNKNLKEDKLNVDKKCLNNIFMVTSASKGDGKTTVSNNLGESFAKSGFKTLIIDANGRNPMMHMILNLANDKGLSNILDNEEVNIQNCNEENLYFLSWGNSNANPADAFIKGDICKIIKNFKQEFDYVIIDTPTITKYADAQILSEAVDEVIFVVSEGTTNRDDVLRAKQIMDVIGVKVAGVFWFNDAR